MVGAAHLATALLVTALIGFGLDLGDTLADGLGLSAGAGSGCADGVGAAVRWAALVPTCGAMCVLAGARLGQMPPMVGVGSVAYAIACGIELSPIATKLSTLVAAVATGWLANAHANVRGLPAPGVAALGIFILVPDGMAEVNSVSSIFTLSHTSARAALKLSATVMEAAVTIAAGLFAATLLLSPRDVDYVELLRGDEAGSRRHLGFGERLRAALAPGAARSRRHGAYKRSRPPVLYF